MTTPRIRPYCTFRVEGLLFGVAVLDVQEVIRHRVPTRVPMAPSFVRGLINLRGQIVTVLDLRERLGLASSEPAFERPIDVIVRVPGGPIGLVADELGDIVQVDEAAKGPIPETIPEAVRSLMAGHYSPSGRSLLAPDIARLLNREV